MQLGWVPALPISVPRHCCSRRPRPRPPQLLRDLSAPVRKFVTKYKTPLSLFSTANLAFIVWQVLSSARDTREWGGRAGGHGKRKGADGMCVFRSARAATVPAFSVSLSGPRSGRVVCHARVAFTLCGTALRLKREGQSHSLSA